MSSLSLPPFAHQLGPGETYAPLRFRVTAETNQQFLFALEDYGADYLGAQGRRALVHPVLLLHMSARTRSPSFRLGPGTGSVFARDVASFVRPANVEEELEVQWTIRDVYERKGRLYQALDTTVRVADSGEPVVRREAHSLFFTHDGAALPVPQTPGRPAHRVSDEASEPAFVHAAIAAGSLPVGALIAGRALALSLGRMLAFSGGAFDEPGWPHANLHTDVNKAREAGLDAIIASGTQSEGLLLGALIDAFGASWHRAGTVDVRFLKPVRVGAVVQPKLRVTAHEDAGDHVRVAVDCWCETDDGARVIDGSASCIARRDEGPAS